MMIQIAEPYVFVGDVFRLLMELGDRPHLVYRLNYRWWLIAPVVDTGGQTVDITTAVSEEPTAPPPIGKWSYFHFGFWGWADEVVGIELPLYLRTVSQQMY